MSATLYFARVHAEPELAHPMFWRGGQALLELYLCADADEDAMERALAFARLARFERCAIEVLKREPDDAPPLPSPQRELAEEARQTGIAWRVIWLRR